MSTDVEDLESESFVDKTKRRKITSEKQFKNYWLSDPQFKHWLLPDKNSKNRGL